MYIPPDYFYPIAKRGNILRIQLTPYCYNEFSGTIVLLSDHGDITITKSQVNSNTLQAEIPLPKAASHTFNIEYRNVLLIPIYIYHMSPEIWNSLPPF